MKLKQADISDFMIWVETDPSLFVVKDHNSSNYGKFAYSAPDTITFLETPEVIDNYYRIKNNIRNKMIAWARYHHFNVIGLLQDSEYHSHYMTFTDILSSMVKNDVFLIDDPLDDAWDKVRNGINSLGMRELEQLETYRHK